MEVKAEKTKEYYDRSIQYSKFYEGKVQVMPKVPVRSLDDFSIWYTPGVAGVSKLIAENRELSFEYTNRWNYVAVVSDGTRVLGLGDIGPEAAMPVMEGKAVLFKYLGGVDAFPIVLNTKDPDEIIQALKWLEPTFGGINLEDISSPKCYYVLEKAREELNIPVWHDDQQGTATVILAGFLNALKLVGKKLSEVKIAFIGAGAANLRTAIVFEKLGKGQLLENYADSIQGLATADDPHYTKYFWEIDHVYQPLWLWYDNLTNLTLHHSCSWPWP